MCREALVRPRIAIVPTVRTSNSRVECARQRYRAGRLARQGQAVWPRDVRARRRLLEQLEVGAHDFQPV